MKCYGRVVGRDALGRYWMQEHFESASNDARKRAKQLRSLGFTVFVSPLGIQVTPVGVVRMTMVDVRNFDGEVAHLPYCEEVRL